MNCREFSEIADSYLSGELLVETNHELIRHLEHCGDCRRLLADRRTLRLHVRNVGRTAAVPRPGFSASVREQIHALDGRRYPRLLVPSLAFACVLLAATLGVLVYSQLNSFKVQDVVVAEKSLKNTELMAALRDAVGNHKDCGLKFGSREAKTATSEYGDLKTNHENLEFVEKHECIFKGKKYSHTIFRSGSKLISVLKASADYPSDSGTIVSTPLDNYQIAEFESGSHAVFVISDLTETENLQFARAIFEQTKS